MCIIILFLHIHKHLIIESNANAYNNNPFITQGFTTHITLHSTLYHIMRRKILNITFTHIPFLYSTNASNTLVLVSRAQVVQVRIKRGGRGVLGLLTNPPLTTIVYLYFPSLGGHCHFTSVIGDSPRAT